MGGARVGCVLHPHPGALVMLTGGAGLGLLVLLAQQAQDAG